ncbi:MAG: hypothetical protein HN712_18420 [Gemmatimonadetes bacterium]|jgi:acetolactate synthase small subunit|nr:hypothetical protein [Gemmatimonadota bacterium]
MAEKSDVQVPGSGMRHWVFRVGVADRAGALTSIASAFSNRGISLETIVGHGTPYPGSEGGAIVATFWCTEEEKEAIVRVVGRLSKVTYLEEHAYESSLLRKSALVKVGRPLRPLDVAGQETFLNCEHVGDADGDYTYFLAGAPSELDPVLMRLAEEGILRQTVYSVIGQ